MKRSNKIYTFLFLIGIIEIASAQYKEDQWADRDTWMDVSKIFKLSNIEAGDFVADIGCHEGYLTIHIAKQVGASGKVYAVDVREDRLNKLDEHLRERKFTHVNTILGDYDNPKLPEKLLDAVVVMDTYHEMDDYMVILKHIKKSLKPDGRIVIIEKFKSRMRNKTRDEQMEAHTLSVDYVKSELEEAGFSISTEIKNFGSWENETNKKIWILVGTPNELNREPQNK